MVLALSICAPVLRIARGALAEQGVDAAGTGFAQLLHFTLGQGFEAALGADGGIDDLTLGHSDSLKA